MCKRLLGTYKAKQILFVVFNLLKLEVSCWACEQESLAYVKSWTTLAVIQKATFCILPNLSLFGIC